MKKHIPPAIEGQFTVVNERPEREPIINSWAGLWWFVIPPITILVVRYAQIKGWL
jgi:hypothetical protein